MAPRKSPTLRRRRLSAELRRLRDASGLTATDVARKLEWPVSKVTRMERGEWLRPSPHDVGRLLEIYEVAERERDALITLAREGRQRGWWHAYREMISERYSTYIGLEAEASSVLSFEPLMIPGLLQTTDYARALILGGPYELGADEAEHRVEIRAERQKILTDKDPARLWVVMDEAAIRRVVGGKDVMRGQLEHLLQMAELPKVTLQMIPFDSGAHPGTGGAFAILSFPHDQDPDAVYVETIAGELFVENEEDVDRFRVAFQRLTAVALSPTDTIALIASAVTEL
ncbi:transcriptional regulator [Actinomadura craniellae]|uniref:Transcriptional regulator n=1 Tax=Actinomadura craniellae TaxID=2231787 RepID=A0A365H416_9ACTN|nr:helix-turn-helix transcriptional regulator [Actinomadura craniellae]RAY13855.1 transcriptional regulator [Actinomadura craniellae]